jgi:hypothetical protein
MNCLTLTDPVATGTDPVATAPGTDRVLERAILNPMTTPPLPEQIELHRDRMWRRDEDRRVESAIAAERFIEDVGFANTLTDARRAGPSLYIAVCGRRDVSLPRNVQKDEETRVTWYLKDEVMRRSRVYYAKLAGGRSMFVAPRLISHFAAIWMYRRSPACSKSAPARTRTGHRGPARGKRSRRTGRLHASPRRVTTPDESDPSGRHLSTDLFLHLEPGRRPVPGRAEKACRAQDGTARDRSSVSDGRRDVVTRRDRARFRFEPR